MNDGLKYNLNTNNYVFCSFWVVGRLILATAVDVVLNELSTAKKKKK